MLVCSCMRFVLTILAGLAEMEDELHGERSRPA